MKAQLVCDALTMAYWRRKPPAGLIMHSDRGVQYAADEHRKLIAQYRMVQSMSRKGNCWDNAPIESFFKTLKVEWVDRIRYATRAQARLDLIDWIEGLTLPGFDVHQNFDSVLMNGGRNGEGNGTESAIHG